MIMPGKVNQKCLEKQCHQTLLFGNNVIIAARLISDLQHAFYLFSSGSVKMGKSRHKKYRAYCNSKILLGESTGLAEILMQLGKFLESR